jgi:predicted enzyme related to lactoylglutathione lyase
MNILTPALLVLAATLLAETPAPPLKATMVVLGVSNLARSVHFYKETLALAAAPAPGDLPMFQSGELTIMLNPGLKGGPDAFELVFNVPSVDTTRKLLADRGCVFLGEPREVAPGLWVATFADPDGHKLTLAGGH